MMSEDVSSIYIVKKLLNFPECMYCLGCFTDTLDTPYSIFDAPVYFALSFIKVLLYIFY